MSAATPHEDSTVKLDVIPVWKQVTPELKAELVAFWRRHQAIADPARAEQRAEQAVAIARDADDAICAVGTAVVRVLPRLRQPMYYYRQFFAPSLRGRFLAPRFVRAVKPILQAYNASLPAPEALGILLEFENPALTRRYTAVQTGAYTFIGYSPRGLQLRVSYFEGARLLPPAPLPRRIAPARPG